jgi:peptidoglycan/xylan/chitin deacetylase (PgdA/CDA1 family)
MAGMRYGAAYLMLFTTSWDDGYASDLPLADLLSSLSLQATFYVSPAKQRTEQMLTEQEIQRLGSRFEIGAHTLTHPKLSVIPLSQAKEEIAGSKAWVERITGKPCTMFCYPKGNYSAEVRDIVRECDFLGARTVEEYCFSVEDPFVMSTSLYVTAFPLRGDWYPRWKLLDPLGPLRARRKQLAALDVPLWSCRSWLSMAKAVFRKALATKAPSFHLWGHTCDFRRFGLWPQLEAFLQFARSHDITPVTNTELVRRFSKA